MSAAFVKSFKLSFINVSYLIPNRSNTALRYRSWNTLYTIGLAPKLIIRKYVVAASVLRETRSPTKPTESLNLSDLFLLGSHAREFRQQRTPKALSNLILKWVLPVYNRESTIAWTASATRKKTTRRGPCWRSETWVIKNVVPQDCVNLKLMCVQKTPRSVHTNLWSSIILCESRSKSVNKCAGETKECKIFYF